MARSKLFTHPTTEAALNTWAAQKRSLFIETEESVASVMGKIKAEQSAAGEGDARRRQNWAEVYTGDGAAVERISRTMPEYPRATLTSFWVLRWPWRVPVSEQALALGIEVRDFWRHLQAAEQVVDSGLQLLDQMRTLSAP